MRLKNPVMTAEHEALAVVTTAHASSNYGIPSVVLADGTVVDGFTWQLFNFQVIEAEPAELEMLSRALQY